MRARLLTSLLVALALAWLIAPPAGAQDAAEGAQTFQQNCAGCHQQDAAGIPGSFPPLRANPIVQDEAKVRDILRNGLTGPIQVLGQSYDGVMPAFPQLDEAQVASVVAYLQTLGETPGTTTTLRAPAAGNPVTGEALFLGSARLTNGAPACTACHTVGTHRHLGSAGLGPDLTGVLTKYGGQAGLSSALANPPSPVMQPVFSAHPLTDQEIADLTAYFGSLAGTPVAGGIDLLPLAGAGGLALLLLGMTFLVRGPRRPYVEQLRSTP